MAARSAASARSAAGAASSGAAVDVVEPWLVEQDTAQASFTPET